MTETLTDAYTTFAGHYRIATGALQTNALAAKRALETGTAGPVLIFDNATGRTVEVDTRGTEEQVAERFAIRGEAAAESASFQALSSRGRGRPKLGVVPREVTLLPRHWDWLASQPGGASVALRKLVEEARRASAGKDRKRAAQERAYHFMVAIGGDLPDFEEATRALFANDARRFEALLAAWPRDISDHAVHLAFDFANADRGLA